MGLLDEAMGNDATYAFGNTDDFAEAITYTPPGANPTVRNINALVIRRRLEESNVTDKIREPALRVGVKNSLTAGVSSAESFAEGYFTIPIRKGHATTERHQIKADSLVSHDGGWMTFEFGPF